MAVVPEPFGSENVVTVHAGVLEMAVHVLGNSRHISRKGGGRRRHRHNVQGRAQPSTTSTLPSNPAPTSPAFPRINVGAIIGGRGRDYDLRGPNFVSDFCTVIVDVRYLPGMTSQSVKADIQRALDAIAAADPELPLRNRNAPRPEAQGLPRRHGAL